MVLLVFTATAVFIFVFSFFLFCCESILIGKQNRGVASASFGDHPHLVSGVGFVAAEKSEALLQAELVFLLVFFGDFAPIACNVSRDKVHRALSALFESGERSRRSDQLSEVEQRFSFGLLHRILLFLNLALLPRGAA